MACDTIKIETLDADEVVSIVTQGPQGPSGAEAATLTAQGDTLYRGVTAPQRLPIGTSGQILRVNSTATAPEWAAPAATGVTSVALASTDLTITGSPITSAGTITANIGVNAVTLDKLQTIQSAHLLGRHGSGNGDVQTVGVGTGLAIVGGTVAVSFSSSAGTASEGNHTHGNLTNDGKIGSTAGLPVVTTTAGAVTTLALGTANQILRVNSGASGVEFADLAAIATSGSASDLTSGTVATARLGTGTASASNFLRGDGTWNAPAAPANMTGATSSTAGTAGLVPQPAAGNEELMLTGAGTFHVPNLPIVKTETTRGITTARWILPPFAQDEGAGSSGGANFEFCGGYVYVPYTGNYYFATRPAAAYSGSTKTCWALYNLATDGLPGTLAVTLGELDVGAGSNVLCESATTVSLTKGWYCCVSRANGSFNLWSPQSHSWLNYIVGKPTAGMISTGSEGKRRFYRSLTYSTTFSSDLTSTTWSEDTNTPPCCWIRRG